MTTTRVGDFHLFVSKLIVSQRRRCGVGACCCWRVAMTLGLCRINRLDKIHQFQLDKIHWWKLDKIHWWSLDIDSHTIKSYMQIFLRFQIDFFCTDINPAHGWYNLSLIFEPSLDKFVDILTKWGRSVITNLVGSHNALIPILVTNAFAATLPLFALPKMLDGFLSETHHSYLNCKIGTDTCRYWHIGVCLCILVPHLAFFKGLQPSLIRKGAG